MSPAPIVVFAVGFAFMRAWGLTYLGNNGVAFPLVSTTSISLVVFVPTMVGSMFLMTLLADRGRIDILSKNAVVLGATLTSAGTLLISRGVDLFYMSEVLGAVGYALLLLQWGVVSSYVSFRRLISSLMLGLPIAGLVCFALCFIPQPALSIVFSLFALVSSWCLGKIVTNLQRRDPDINLSTGDTSVGFASDNTGKFLLVRMVVALFFLELVGRSTLSLSGEFATRIVGLPSYSFALARFAGTLVAALLYFLFVVRSSKPLRTMYLLTPVLLIASCLFIIFGQMGIMHVTYALAFSAGAWLETVFWLFFSHSFKSIGKSPVFVWMCGRAAFWLSTLVGVLFWNAQSSAFDNGLINDASALTTFIVLLALDVMLSYTVMLPESSLVPLGMLRDRDKEKGATNSSFDDSARNLAAQARLSPRETEVFLLLAHGRDTAYIQEQLVISQGTVCSHRDRIYRKLGIHSKQELVDLVDQGTR